MSSMSGDAFEINFVFPRYPLCNRRKPMNAAVQSIPITISRPMPSFPVFIATYTAIAVRAGAVLADVNFPDETQVELPELVAGTDYRIDLVDGRPVCAVLRRRHSGRCARRLSLRAGRPCHPPRRRR